MFAHINIVIFIKSTIHAWVTEKKSYDVSYLIQTYVDDDVSGESKNFKTNFRNKIYAK